MSVSKSSTIIGEPLPNLPWEERPAGSSDVMWRYSANPIIGWNPIPSGARAYNSAVVPYGDGFVGVFRIDSKSGRAGLHFGRSKDALNWDLEDKMIDWVDENGNPNPNSFAYDPRVVKIDDRYYITWCDDLGGASIGMGYTKDFKTFVKTENPLMPFNRNGVLFPRKINGEYVLLSRPSDSAHTPFGDIFLSHSKDMTYWGKHRLVMKAGGSGWWQGVKIGAGPIPIETKEGWLMFYHGVSTTCSGFVYSIGAAILDIDDPSKVLYRTRGYLLTPEKSYESTGFVPNVTFPCATMYDAPSGKIAIYYGAADTYSAVAFTQVDELIDFIKNDSEV
ncbi:glycoside hydrolase family 130 protein [Pelagicoccus sp. SDUM812003]|uniref:glycoside hydrolase family 130 protein n=1 Tax=Pelagicoccus sp. SDUM812003 TaxID=3041267 RepID=UPI00280DAF4E|nr:glycoside hydrolase family 130 protein [Pelagicoccus sp. SDUM812003]MDQ8204608.1 glycoside hydrolase family 130 protein [Pelagicoccus sp. SDUM812003]